MALKKKKIEQPEVVEAEVVENINEAEKEAIANDNEVSVASTEKIALANELLAHQFNIDETFHVTKVDDKGNTLTLGFANLDYEVQIKIKNVEEMGLITPEY